MQIKVDRRADGDGLTEPDGHGSNASNDLFLELMPTCGDRAGTGGGPGGPAGDRRGTGGDLTADSGPRSRASSAPCTPGASETRRGVDGVVGVVTTTRPGGT